MLIEVSLCALKCELGNLQLPPQTRTGVFSLALRSIFKHVFEYSANHAVPAASGTVAATGDETEDGTLKQIFSSATVY